MRTRSPLAPGTVVFAGGTPQLATPDYWGVFVPRTWLTSRGIATYVGVVNGPAGAPPNPSAVFADEPDLIWVFRPFRQLPASWWSLLRTHARRIVIFLDDYVWGIPASNDVWRLSGVSARQRRLDLRDMEKQLIGADVVIATTPPLADMCRRLNRATHLIPLATAPINVLPEPMPVEHAGIRIGWAGSTTHAEDLDLLRVPLRRLLAEREDVAMIFMGEYPRWSRGLSRVEYHDVARSYDEYLVRLIMMACDIFVAPLVANRFNEAKGAVKAFEAWMNGWAFVGSDLGPYAHVVRHGETGLVVKNHADAWLEALTTLIEHPELRQSLGENGRRELAAHHTIETVGPLWADALGLNDAAVKETALSR